MSPETLVVAGCGLAGVILTWIGVRRRNKIETGRLEVEQLRELADQNRQDREELRSRLAALEAAVSELRSQVHELEQARDDAAEYARRLLDYVYVLRAYVRKLGYRPPKPTPASGLTFDATG